MENLLGPLSLLCGVGVVILAGLPLLGIHLFSSKKRKSPEQRAAEQEFRKRSNPMRLTGRSRDDGESTRNKSYSAYLPPQESYAITRRTSSKR